MLLVGLDDKLFAGGRHSNDEEGRRLLLMLLVLVLGVVVVGVDGGREGRRLDSE